MKRIVGTESDAGQWDAFAEELDAQASAVYQNAEYSAYNALHRTSVAASNVAKRIRAKPHNQSKATNWCHDCRTTIDLCKG